MKLANALNAWNAPGFNQVLKEEIEGLDVRLLPLQAGMVHGSHLAGDAFSVTVLGATDEGHYIRVKVGVFFNSIIAGCSCADDPTPINENAEYCELCLDIDKRTGEATVAPR